MVVLAARGDNSVREAFSALFDNISEKVPHPENEYLAEDGFYHCSKCNEAVQTEIEVFGQKKIVQCICSCRLKEIETEKERAKQERNERRRKACFVESNMANWTFENDDRQNAKLSEAMLKYAENFAEFKKESKGLLLYGGVGTGKTYFAACIANKLIDKGYSVLMTNFARLTNQIQGMYEGKQEFIDSLNKYSLLIIDDLGAERKSEFMQEMVFNIIDSRYRSGLPLIITTNLTTDEIKQPKETSFARIYDRVLERCFPIEVSGHSRRRKNVKDSYFDIKEKLGL